MTEVSPDYLIAPAQADKPPPNISPKAEKLLTDWGTTEREIQQLIDIISSFDYDNCIEKARSIAARGGILFKQDANQHILLPKFLNYDGNSGQCYDITINLLTALHSGAWLDGINNRRQSDGEKPLQLCFIEAEAPTHFRGKGSNHVCCGLIPEEAKLSEMVIIDASFQSVQPLKGSKYKVNECLVHAVGFEGCPVSGTVQLGKYEARRGGYFEFSVKDDLILGLSSDRTLSYGLSFVRDTKSGRICPTICIGFENTKELLVSAFMPNGETIWYGHNSKITSEHEREIEIMLRLLKEIEISHDQTIADMYKNACVNIYF